MDKPLVLVIFNVFVIAMLVLDLKVFHRREHEVSVKEAAYWSVFWIILSLLFCFGLFMWDAHTDALEYLTGYLIEKARSVDNLFVFIMIFAYFGIPSSQQHKILFWGIVGALIMRGAFILAGAALVASFHWILYVFGIVLLISGVKMFANEEVEVDPSKNIVNRYVKKIFPLRDDYEGVKFFIRRDRKFYITPMLLVLITIETSDIIFAFDSIPAIFAVTEDPFIIYTSNIFAILGLRALYFLLAAFMKKFEYLKTGLAIVLVFIALKMLLMDIVKIPITVSLAAVVLILAVAVTASIFKQRRKE